MEDITLLQTRSHRAHDSRHGLGIYTSGKNGNVKLFIEKITKTHYLGVKIYQSPLGKYEKCACVVYEYSDCIGVSICVDWWVYFYIEMAILG
jgi:hypothetical protein